MFEVDIAREGLTDLMAERLADDLWQRMPAFAAATKDKTEWLFEQGMDANSVNWLGMTALHELAGNGNQEIAELFLQHGADIDHIDFECKSTPLGYVRLLNT